MVTLFEDSTQIPRDATVRSEWPTEASLPVYRRLAEAFADNPQVLFGLMNEPHDTPERNAELAAIFNRAIEEIRSVERARRVPQHIIVAQAPQLWAREVQYFIDHPLTGGGGTNIAYEVHPYNPPSDYERLVVQPARRVPLIIGECAPFEAFGTTVTEADVQQLFHLAEDNDVPYLGWMFHQRCEPDMLEDTGGPGYDQCGFNGAGTVFRWQPTSWGTLLKNQLARPWGSGS
jgi:hypothetical protein